MWEQLNGDPNIASIFMGDKYGNFCKQEELPLWRLGRQESRVARVLIFGSLKTERTMSIKTQSSVATFDARTRVWYQRANENGKFY